MAEPSNIRVNPFTGTGGATNYVELTERHVIPAVSPYVIRLNEVPEKQDPSNMKMVYVDSATGAATENTLTEVAATPGQGEFRPDYSTNAMEDKSWNTGLIEFSASDAGKMVQITYTGTGTLAAVNSNNWPSWYTDRGDGSDGDFVPESSTTISGVKNYKSVFIKSGITITVDKYVKIKCQEAFINGGTITSVGRGAAGGSGGNEAAGSGGASGNLTTGGAGGSSKSGSMGMGSLPGGAGGTKTALFIVDMSYDSILYGAGGGGGGGSAQYNERGGNGGSGGGDIIITASSINNTGTITSNGANGSSGASRSGGGGGGGGGRVIAICNTFTVKGTITANGGSGGGGYSSGAGGSNGIAYTKELGVI